MALANFGAPKYGGAIMCVPPSLPCPLPSHPALPPPRQLHRPAPLTHLSVFPPLSLRTGAA